ncbi:hypothetical protein BD309DRAFT_963724 [Dichomitus squalens]|uniref:Uncharacterized protein n=1 Tax=Dichomitus squalens TaxID=114155 RepID=A0A4Q9PNY5_9APHY|nr:hypothetical protein BD309DRAFT_963724 [Dichomitus squalens]TBU56013.1 hypothetical protein BD310DRAFT_932406 [Dichomitus squalens]
MSDPLEQYVHELENSFVNQADTSAGLVLLLYDISLTFDREIRHVWVRGRIHITAVLFVIRHVQLASLVLNLISIYYAHLSAQVCFSMNIISSIFVILPYFGWAVFLGWRAYALSSRNALVGLLAFLCSASFAAPSLVILIVASSQYVGPATCTTSYAPGGETIVKLSLLVSRPMALLADLVVLGLTCTKTMKEWLSSEPRNHKASLVHVLFVNGVIWVSVTTIMHILTFVEALDGALESDKFGQLSVLRDVIVTVVLSRYILDLAEVGADTSDATQASQGVLTTQWTDAVSGVLSQYPLDEEYDGRGFDQDIAYSHCEA